MSDVRSVWFWRATTLLAGLTALFLELRPRAAPTEMTAANAPAASRRGTDRRTERERARGTASGRSAGPPAHLCRALALLASEPRLAHELLLELGPRRVELSGCGAAPAAVPSLALMPSEARRTAALGLLADSDDARDRTVVLRLARRSVSELSEAALERLAAAPRLDPDALAHLRTVLTAPNRRAAERLLDAIGPAALADPEIWRSTVALVAHRGDSLRRSALTAVGRAGTDEAVDLLEDRLGAPPPVEDHKAVALALAKMSHPRARAVVLAAADHPRAEVFEAALEALLEMEGDDVREPLIRALRAGGRRAEVAGAYLRDHPEALSFEELRRMASTSSDAVLGLARLGGAEAEQALEDLARSPDAATRGEALRALGEMPEAAARTRNLALDLIQAGRQDVSRDVLDDLARTGDGRTIAVMLKSLRGESADSDVAVALLASGRPELVPELESLVLSEGVAAPVRHRIIRALVGDDHPAAAGILRRVVVDGPVSSALHGLDAMPSGEGTAILAAAATSPHPEVRSAAARKLGYDGSKEAVSHLVALADREPPGPVRLVTLVELAGRHPGAVEQLAETLSRADTSSREEFYSRYHRYLVQPGLRDQHVEHARSAAPASALHAVVALARGGRESAPALAGLVDDPTVDLEVRRTAGRSLREMGKELSPEQEDLLSARSCAAPVEAPTEDAAPE